jgi:glyoxylate/hydroxypyruvate reductase A
LNYRLSGWSQTPREVEGITSFHGPEGLTPFLAQTDILVCLLPLTPKTKGILNAQLFAGLPEGACVINAARGGHLVEQDLLAALDTGHLRGATLDVFAQEPLPADNTMWSHPKIVVTPHSAHVARTIARVDEGLAPENLVDFSRGY